tara:strand:- start:159 stop:887 length:729 start_codon:yes stop_codon:yes gene_type:complete
MQILRITALIAGLVTSSNGIYPLKAKEISTTQISQKLEKALNSQKSQSLKSIFTTADLARFKSKYKKFSSIFPNSTWDIKPSQTLDNGRYTFKVTTNGSRENGPHKFVYKSEQLIAFKMKNQKIYEHEIINHSSILRTKSKGLSLTINIPEKVLTGSNYDLDIIINEPLNNDIIAGGLTNISLEQFNELETPVINLSPMGGGGLFKKIKAPMQPGKQVWAAIIIHPKGITTITKLVRIVPNY